MTFTIKHDAHTDHIAGITTGSGLAICSALGRSGSFETGATYGELRDAVNAVGLTGRQVCRVCRIGADLILKRSV